MRTAVKRLYANYLPGKIRPYSDIRKQATSLSLRKILNREKKASDSIQGMACIDYSFIGLTEDTEEADRLIKKSIRINSVSKNVVRVSFQQKKNSAPTVIYYKMVCSNNNHCLVDDIAYKKPNNSLKREILTCLKEYEH